MALKARILPSFPLAIRGTDGVTVATSGGILTIGYTFTGAFSNTVFTQGGTGAVQIDLNSLYEGTVIVPEMFDTAANIASNAKNAIQRAMDYANMLGGATVVLAPKQYNVSGEFTYHPRVHLVGTTPAQFGGTILSWTPSTRGASFFPIGSSGGGITSGVTIKNVDLVSPDVITYKIGIDITDGSFVHFEDVYVALNGGFSADITGAASSGAANEIRLTVANASVNFNDGYTVAVSGVGGTVEANDGWEIKVVDATHIDLKGSTFTNAYTSGGTIAQTSEAMRIRGRELITCDRVTLVGDVGLHIAANPNFSTNGLDETNFNNMTIVSTSTSPNVLIGDGVNLTSVQWSGYQSWGGGKSGLKWVDRSAPSISEQVRIANVRSEQKSVGGGWHFDIQPNTNVYSLTIENAELSDRNGIRARNIKNLLIAGTHCLSDTATALDIDSTVQLTTGVGNYWISGSTANISGQTLETSSGTISGATLKSNFVYHA